MRDVRCEGCGDRFRCRVDDEQPCWCDSVDASDGVRVALAAVASDCVCPACLADAVAGVAADVAADVDA